ncbi:transposase [Candidatus Mesenet endosymbiont of Phosphuga atrata]
MKPLKQNRKLYLPPYSPDLNPIEHCSHTIKSYL